MGVVVNPTVVTSLHKVYIYQVITVDTENITILFVNYSLVKLEKIILWVYF